MAPHDQVPPAEVLEARRLRERSRELMRRSVTLRQGLGEVVAQIIETREAVRRLRVRQAGSGDEPLVDRSDANGPA